MWFTVNNAGAEYNCGRGEPASGFCGDAHVASLRGLHPGLINPEQISGQPLRGCYYCGDYG